MYAQVLMQGFIPDTLLVHPMTWLTWVKDPTLREFAIMAGGGSFFANFTGNAAAQAFAGQYNYMGLGQGLGQNGQYVNGNLTGGQTSTPQGLPQNQTSAPVLPSYLPMNFRILVSPFVRFDPIARNTDMLLFDSKQLGALIVDEDPHVNAFDEKQFGLHNMMIEECYGFGILNEGQAIGVAKNIAIKPNEFITPTRSYIDIAAGGSVFEEVDSVTGFGSSPLNVLGR
jgi:hypothetical protein